MDVREIYGIGAKKASELRKHYNIRTVSVLKRYVRKLPDIITDAQRYGLIYHDQISKRVTYKEAEAHVNYITKHIQGHVAGSFRRKAKYIHDIDILVLCPLNKVIEKLTQLKYIVATLAIGEERFSGIVKLPTSPSYRRLDVMRTTREELPFAILYFTGDFVQNITMRQKAKKMGYVLSQHGLFNAKTNRAVANLKSEKDIFNFLGIPYVPPEERTHEGVEKETLAQLRSATALAQL